MFRILVMNGLLISLVLIWTSAARESSSETLIKTLTKLQTGPREHSLNETNMKIQSRKSTCSSELDGKCIKIKKRCPKHLPFEKSPGKPYCSKKERCCFPEISCSLAWDYEEDRPLIMIRESKTIVPPITDLDISNDPNRIPEGIKLIFACPGENNQFNHVQGTHTKLHGECISRDLFKVCVNNNPEVLDLKQLSCSRQMSPSIIKQDKDTIYKKSCDVVDGELYKFGYIYGDNKEFKDLENNICFREKDQKTLWTSSNLKSNAISPSVRFRDPFNNSMNTEATSVWNDKACRNHGGHCVRGGKPCPKHLPYQTSQGEPFCSSFYRCCYSDPCDPATCTHKGQTGNCGLDSLPGTIKVGSQECKKGCQCYIKDSSIKEQRNKEVLHHLTRLQVEKEFSNILRGKCGEVVVDKSCVLNLVTDRPAHPPLILDQTYNAVLTGTVTVSHGEDLIFVCSGTEFDSLNTGSLKMECTNGNLLYNGAQLLWKDMSCKSRILSTIQEKKSAGVQKNCNNGGGLLWEIGLETKQPNPAPSIYSLIDVCYDKNKETTLWTKSTIKGHISNEWFPKGKRPNWIKGPGFFENINMDHIYSSEKQKTFFEGFTNDVKIKTEEGKEKFFNRGHLTPRMDFVTKGESDATFWYSNALPQWIEFNSGNWEKIETKIVAEAKKSKKDFQIITGGFSVMEAKNKDINAMDPVYLGKAQSKAGKVPIPDMFWKAVIEKSTNKDVAVFIITNNPIYSTAPAFKCTNICGNTDNQIPWIASIKGDFDKREKGFAYCCTIQDFHAKFPGINWT